HIPSPGYVALKGRCPACGRGKLYRGLLTIAERCAVCGLEYSGHEQGDGPAFFGIVIIGTLAGIGAAITEIRYEPPFWLHAAIWVPFILLGSVAVLRWMKAAIIAIQYRTRRQDFDQF